MFFWSRRAPLTLYAALLIYGLLAVSAMREVGLVGEVAIGWGLGRPPQVAVRTDPLTWADGASEAPNAGARLGPLVASQVRPIEGLRWGELGLPLAINSYTGGPPDWPALLLTRLSGRPGPALALHLALGGLLIVLAHRFLRSHGSDIAAAVTALALATDWSFLFYRRALGGTELLLLAAGLLCLWSQWSRRWKGGRLGVPGFALGVGLGLLAKGTFALTLAALLLAALLTRWDRPALRPPLPARWWASAGLVLLLCAPLGLAALHHALGVPADPHVQSHDFVGVQLNRVAGLVSAGRSPARESWVNLSYWMGDPLAFFGPAYGAVSPPAWRPWRVVAWVMISLGVLLAWRDRHPTPQQALLRFLSLFVPIQLGLLLLFARDLHHLAQATLPAAMVVGLAAERLAAVATPARSFPRARAALLIALPWIGTGAAAILRTDSVLRTVATPTFTASGQDALVALLRDHQVRRLVDCNYELMGFLELRAEDIGPGFQVQHTWGAASRAGQPGGPGRAAVLAQSLKLAQGGHYLVVRPSAPMIYDLSADPTRIAAAAEAAGVTARLVGEIPGKAWLYGVE